MKFPIFPVLLLAFASCGTVRFNQPQPKDGIRLTEFPEEVRGTWAHADGDFFTIDSAGITYSRVYLDSARNYEGGAERYVALSDSIRLYRGGKYYVYNELSSRGFWTFVVSKVDNGGNIYNYRSDDVKFFTKLNELSVDSAKYNVPRYDPELNEVFQLDKTLYNPTKKELFKIDSDALTAVYFNGQISIKDLRKIAIRKNLVEIYWADGRHEGKLKPPKQGDNEPEE
jgi:hypothetical protein